MSFYWIQPNGIYFWSLLFDQIRVQINQFCREDADSDDELGSKMSMKSRFDYDLSQISNLSQSNCLSLATPYPHKYYLSRVCSDVPFNNFESLIGSFGVFFCAFWGSFSSTNGNLKNFPILSIGDLINLDPNFDLYCDQIDFFDLNLKPDFNSS